MSEKFDVFDVACPYCGKTTFGVLLKPGTTHRVICPECKKATYVKVLEDLSVQVFREEEVCPDCHGTGYVECPKCGGDGFLVYTLDNGKVYRISEADTGWHGWYVIGCPQCGGSGSYRVSEFKEYFSEVLKKLENALESISKGSGRVKCKRCNGRGFLAGNLTI
ncbi:hypothetical protein [Infirmifilum sp. NZ]|uniref:hypothetical protein n=1 Tax=Infirmifilum sp. NZ TaxID=2926850 RepID=UPI00279A25FD|nr:hypothetical protein [Infirmifilum sp. NZ]UNQ73408.1 hypothetical protein MOV14_09890 [Infirmifilum sp. NZ]